MRKIGLSILCGMISFHMCAQHFYYRLDVATSNVYSFVVSHLATAGLNTLVDGMLFDNSYTYTYMQKTDNIRSMDVNGYKVTGLTARELFGDVTTGAKLGYQTYFPAMVNGGIYGSAHYRINQFKTIESGHEDIYRHNLHRLLLGGGLFFTIGDIESSTKWVVEAGIRYEMPMRYAGIPGMRMADALNKGLSSHYAIRINGNGVLQGVGIYADIPHYSLFTEMGKQVVGSNLKMFTFGVIFTITPWKIKNLYDL